MFCGLRFVSGFQKLFKNMQIDFELSSTTESVQLVVLHLGDYACIVATNGKAISS